MFKKLLFTALALLFSGASHSATIETTHSPVSLSGGFNDNTGQVLVSESVLLDLFDPTLGTLNSFDISMSTRTHQLSASAVQQSPDSILSLSAESFFGIDIPVLATLPFGGLSGSGTCETSGTSIPACHAELTVVNPITVPTLPPFVRSDPTFLALFTGVGTFAADIFLSVESVASLRQLSPGTSPVRHPSDVASSWIGTATIIYDYTPSPIPIPAAIWLFGTALIGLVGMSRRRKVA